MRRIFVFSLFLLVVAFIFLVFRKATDERNLSESPEELIKKSLPEGAYLRDYSLVENKFLVLYLEKGYRQENWDFDTCPGNFLGNALAGNYHISLVEDGKIVSDAVLPKYFDSDGVSLPVKNTKSNILVEGVFDESEKDDLLDIKLLDLKDLTGDGKAHEFNLITTRSGCGFYDGLVGGYDATTNSVVIYSDWLPRFKPDSNGNFRYLLECGDHGNEVRYEAEYRFNREFKKFEKYRESQSPC